MLRLIIASIAVTGAFALAPTAAAAPGMCDNHGVGPGIIYKTACGATSGTGGGGPTIHYVDSDGNHHKVSADEYRKVLKANQH